MLRRWAVVLGMCSGLLIVGACEGEATGRVAGCAGDDHVQVCAKDTGDWAFVSGAQPGTYVTWTLDGEATSVEVPDSDGPIRIDLRGVPTRSAQLTFAGTGTDGHRFNYSTTIESSR